MGACISKPSTPKNRRASTECSSGGKDDVKTERPPLDLTQFELRRVIGRGTFGKVKVVVHKPSGNTYALKYISKVACVARQAAVNVIRERKIMEVLHHPLVCNLRYAFQDVDYLYLVSDLMLGGDLRFHLLRRTFTEDAIRMWMAETVAALSYCHQRGIVHRDVKPDNVLLTAAGHCKLADFNISTQIRNGTLPRTRSGSLFYMAPEIHEGVQYDFAVDYWSLGVVFYESIYGHRPFFGKNSNDLMHSIRQNEAPITPCTPAVSSECEDAIRALMRANPRMRCHTQSEVAALSFFAPLDWPKISQGQGEPVFVPGSDKNFDAAWELEEILLHDSPLEPRRQATKKKLVPENQAAADIFELMEVHFTDFDYTATTAPVDEKLGILQNPSSLLSETALASGVQEAPTEGLVADDVDEKRLSVETKAAAAAVATTPPNAAAARKGSAGTGSGAATTAAAAGSSGGFFKSKPKKPVVVPAGVLAMKAGGRVKVSTMGL